MIRNDMPLLVTKGREAHRPSPPVPELPACDTTDTTEAMAYVQLLVWVKPTWCPDCFNGKDPS